MSDLLSGLRGLKSSSGVFGENIFILVDGFDDANQLILGRRIEGRAPVGEQLGFKLSTFGMSASRATFADIRDSSHMARLDIGNVYYIQGASMVSGLYEYRWGNIACRDIKKCVVGKSPAIVHAPVDNKGKKSQRITLVKSENQMVCVTKDSLLDNIAGIADDAKKKGLLGSYGVLVQVIQNDKNCVGYNIGFYSSTLNDNIGEAIKNIVNSEVFVGIINHMQEKDMWANDSIKVVVAPTLDTFIPHKRIAKTAKTSDLYTHNGVEFYRESVYLLEYVTNKSNESFWSMQVCGPSHINAEYMPCAFVNDKNNISRADIKASEK
jgi:hypothetical protein